MRKKIRKQHSLPVWSSQEDNSQQPPTSMMTSLKESLRAGWSSLVGKDPKLDEQEEEEEEAKSLSATKDGSQEAASGAAPATSGSVPASARMQVRCNYAVITVFS